MNVLQYVILTILSVISIFPFFWMIIAATNKSVDVTKGTLTPGTYFMENLNHLLESDLQYVNAFKNSLFIAVVTTVLAMLVSSAAGYAFEVFRTKTKDKIFNLILLSMICLLYTSGFYYHNGSWNNNRIVSSVNFNFNVFSLTIYSLLWGCNRRSWFKGSAKYNVAAIAHSPCNTTGMVAVFLAAALFIYIVAVIIL